MFLYIPELSRVMSRVQCSSMLFSIISEDFLALSWFPKRLTTVACLIVFYFRCSSCEYKFETTEDLRTHQRMECGKGDYREDDNLSISGDEDVSTLNDMAGTRN